MVFNVSGRYENGRWRVLFKGGACLTSNSISRTLDSSSMACKSGVESNYSRSSKEWPAVNRLTAGSRGRSRWTTPFRGNWTDSSQGLVAGLLQGWHRRVTFTKWLRAIFASSKRRTLRVPECRGWNDIFY